MNVSEARAVRNLLLWVLDLPHRYTDRTVTREEALAAVQLLNSRAHQHDGIGLIPAEVLIDRFPAGGGKHE